MVSLQSHVRFFANNTQGYPIPLKNWNATTNTITNTKTRTRKNMIRQQLAARDKLAQRRGSGRLRGNMQDRPKLEIVWHGKVEPTSSKEKQRGS
jgi:hypothetical protein